jgi:hypothetical protein
MSTYPIVLFFIGFEKGDVVFHMPLDKHNNSEIVLFLFLDLSSTMKIRPLSNIILSVWIWPAGSPSRQHWAFLFDCLVLCGRSDSTTSVVIGTSPLAPAQISDASFLCLSW